MAVAGVVATLEVGIAGHHGVRGDGPLEVFPRMSRQRHVGRRGRVPELLGEEHADEVAHGPTRVLQRSLPVAGIAGHLADIPDAQADDRSARLDHEIPITGRPAGRRHLDRETGIRPASQNLTRDAMRLGSRGALGGK